MVSHEVLGSMVSHKQSLSLRRKAMQNEIDIFY